MRLWVTRFAALLGGVVAAPIAVEGLIAYIKGERYSMSRAGVIFGCLLVAGGMLTILRVLVQRLQQLLEVGLLVLGVTTSVAGLMLVTQVGPRTDAVGVFIACLGLLIAGFAGYLIYAVNTGADLAFAAPRMTGNHVDQEFDGAGHSVLLRRYPTFTASDEEVANACRERLSPADVHFIGYYVNGRCKFHVDVLENAELSRFFRHGPVVVWICLVT